MNYDRICFARHLGARRYRVDPYGTIQRLQSAHRQRYGYGLDDTRLKARLSAFLKAMENFMTLDPDFVLECESATSLFPFVLDFDNVAWAYAFASEFVW